MELERYTFAECDRASVMGVQQEMTQIATQVLRDSTQGVDFQAMVAREWRALNMDAVFDAQVRGVVEQIRNEPREWWDFSLFTTGWSPAQAEALAERVIGDVLTSAEFSQAMNQLGDVLAVELAREIELMSARSATSMLLCLQAYVGTAYTENLYAAFAQQTFLAVGTDETLADLDAEVQPDLVELHMGALAGGGVLILTAVSRQIAQSLGRTLAGRLAGRVVTRIVGRAGAALVPYAGWVVGLGLLLYDLFSGAQGALPQIESALLEDDIKIAIRQEVAATLAAGLAAEVDFMATTLAIGLVNEWTEFCNMRPALCTLAQANADYRNILASTPLAHLDALDRLTQTYLDRFGRGLLEQAITNGEFYRLASLPPAAVAIFDATLSVDVTSQWVNAAAQTGVPDSVARLAEREIHMHFAPGDLTPAELATIITIEDNEALNRLVDLDLALLTTLLALIPAGELAGIVAGSTEAELAWYGDYLSTLDATTREQVNAELAAGEVTLAALRQRTEAATETNEAANGDRVGLVGPPGSGTPGNGTSGSTPESSAAQDANGETGTDVSPVARLGRQLLNTNSILVATLFIFVLVVAAAAFIAARQSDSEPVE